MNTIKYFIGIVPPEEIYQKVLDIQKQFGDNRLEPHITLRPPVTPVDPTGWIHAVEAVCQGCSPFNVALPASGKFGNRVLFIDVRSSQLTDLHEGVTKAIKQFEPVDPGQQQNQSFTAHLTLGRSWCGFSPQDFAAMKKLADEYLAEEPVAFEVNFVRVYHKPSQQGRYQALLDIPLAGPLP
jgi:2'-5' RNA ligase